MAQLLRATGSHRVLEMLVAARRKNAEALRAQPKPEDKEAQRLEGLQKQRNEEQEKEAPVLAKKLAEIDSKDLKTLQNGFALVLKMLDSFSGVARTEFLGKAFYPVIDTLASSINSVLASLADKDENIAQLSKKHIDIHAILAGIFYEYIAQASKGKFSSAMKLKSAINSLKLEYVDDFVALAKEFAGLFKEFVAAKDEKKIETLARIILNLRWSLGIAEKVDKLLEDKTVMGITTGIGAYYSVKTKLLTANQSQENAPHVDLTGSINT